MSRGIMVVGVDRPTSVQDIEMMKAAERGFDRMQIVELRAPKLNILNYPDPDPIAEMGPLMRLAGHFDFDDRGRGNKLKEPFGKSKKRRRV